MSSELEFYESTASDGASKEVFQRRKSTILTPMMQQYLSIKAEYQDCLLCFRLGDFYELFFEDAETASPVLEVVLTARGKHLDDEIPMCGIPYHSADLYWAKLLKAGYKLAICEQLETPQEARKRGVKAVVRREVVRVMTPGTLVEEHLLNARESQYLIALHLQDEELVIACADLTTGACFLEYSPTSLAANVLGKLRPHEILLAEKLYVHPVLKPILASYKSIISFRPDTLFQFIKAQQNIQRFYQITELKAVADFTNVEIIVLGVLLEYISYTHKENAPNIELPRRLYSNYFLEIDAATRRNLELFQSVSSHKDAAIFRILNHTVTAMGSRLFLYHGSFVLTDKHAIDARLDMVEFFYQHPQILQDVRNYLSKLTDLQRIMMKFSTKRGTFSDLVILRESLMSVLDVASLLRNTPDLFLPEGLRIAMGQIGNFGELLSCLHEALLPLASLSGGSALDKPLNHNYWPKLSVLYNVRDNSGEMIEALKEKYRSSSGISNLKITHNNIIGYFIEVSASNLSKIKPEMGFMLKQSMLNYTRFTTVELNELAVQIESCNAEIIQEEAGIMQQLVEKVLSFADSIYSTAHSIASIDVAVANAFCALKFNYVRPVIVDDCQLNIVKGRHPLVERYAGTDFVPNSCHMSEGCNIWLITGPNMAGKSTFLRQNAIIIILAQMGCFIPAESATIGVVDKLFSRIGAADDIAAGHSTFMVEMVETAYILNNATSKSFLILDEVGRGTSTQDGLAIARSIVEQIHDKVGARTMFATHYHELGELENTLDHLACYTLKVSNWQDQLVLLHEIVPGCADRSFGLHVARMAGIPRDVITRAQQLLASQQPRATVVSEVQVAKPHHQDRAALELAERLQHLKLESLTPKAALDLLYNWQEEITNVPTH
jgi:DNA mismatch repair protein MutS